jgi:glycosyltransferase involved in cell wall biosynthesis
MAPGPAAPAVDRPSGPLQGFETLIRAVAATPGVELLIAGDGELRPALEDLIRQVTPAGQPAVRLLGRCDETEKQHLLAHCELFCLASCERTEAFGLVVLEAMRAGVPCLVSELAGSGLPWIVHSSGAGWCVPPHDVPAWQTALQRALQSPTERARAGAAGQQAFAQRFTVEACTGS